MANEKRLDVIDRNALIASCRAMLMTDVYPGWIKMPNKEKNIAGKISDTFKRIITNAPTVDAEEVIRCKDCIHAEPLPTNCELSASHYMCCGLWRGKETLNILHKQERNFLGHVFEENYYKDYSLVKCDGYCDSGARMDGDGDGTTKD